MLEVIAVILAALGLFAAYYFRPRRNPDERPRPKGVVHAMRWWRSRAFDQALAYMNDYSEAHKHIAMKVSARSITQRDVYTWGCNVLLTAASRISRYSQGKANLFVVNEVKSNSPPSLTLRSQQFIGAFPLYQLITGKAKAVYNYRDMPVSDQATTTTTVASSAVLHNKLTIDKIGAHVSDAEKSLGTTHILAIPICDGIEDVESGEAAVITVDFRLPLRVQFLQKFHIWLSEGRILRRAKRLQDEARRFVRDLPEERLSRD